MSEMAQKTGKVGGQKGNQSAKKHGCYVQKWDRRTREARAIEHVQAELSTALGDPTPQQILILQRASVKAVRCALFEAEILRTNGDTAQSLKDDYLRWARELRADLLALGLERRAKNVTDPATFYKERYGEE